MENKIAVTVLVRLVAMTVDSAITATHTIARVVHENLTRLTISLG